MIIRQSLTQRGSRITASLSKSWMRSLTSEITHSEAAALSHNDGDQFSVVAGQSSTPPASEVTHTKASSSDDKGDGLSVAGTRQLSDDEGDGLLAAGTQQLSDEERIRREFFYQRQRRYETGQIGSTVIKPDYIPRTLIYNPPSPSDITLELLLASQSHLGHSTSRWNPANSRYIFGIRQGIHIISLDVTASHLRRACRVVSGVTERGGLVLFVGTRRGQDACVVRAAQLAGGCHLFERWTPGTITNGPQLLRRCKMKLVDELDHAIKGYDHMLVDRPPLRPDLVVCLNPRENWVMLHECALNAIPTMGIIDTDANPTWVTYPIPANDDSLRCVEVIAGALGRAGQEGKRSRIEMAKEGIITYSGMPLSRGPGKE